MTDAEAKAINKASADFDPLAWRKDAFAHPNKYTRLSDCIHAATLIQTFRKAKTMDELKHAFTDAKKKAVGNTEVLTMLKTASDARKAELA